MQVPDFEMNPGTEKEKIFLTRAGSPTGQTTNRSTGGLPLSMQKRAVVRLRYLSLVVCIIHTVLWLGVNLIEGQLLDELQRLQDAIPAGLLITSSLAVYLLARSKRLALSTMGLLGLVYQVLVSYCLAFLAYWSAFIGVDAGWIDGDRIGVAIVALWMFTYTVLVPDRPRRILIALLASSLAIPIVYALSAHVGDAPVLGVQVFFFTLVFPYLLTALAAYICARVIFSLGRALKHAQDIGSYKLESLIGKGGMGEVWRARHSMLARPAAIKLIRPDAVGTNPDAAGNATERFEREAQATAGLKSLHTVQLYEYGTSQDGNLYYVMELLSGIDLESLVQKYGPVQPGRVVWILSQVCHSLADAHHQGLIHRDIKPANIVICNMGLDYDFVKVLDFGLVALQPQIQAEDAKLTADGIVTGTPAYLAPEMASGGKVDGRADLYALGCVAYWLLTGRLVFEADTPVASILAHATQEPVPPSNISELEIPDSLERIILACLSKDPQQRPASAAVLAEQLAACDLPSPWSNSQASNWWKKHKPLD